MSVKITALEAENVKRIKAVALTPAPTGLTLVGGNNNQGKTSVLDALAWALGGEKFRPNAAQRDGAVAPAHLRVTLSNGVVVERKGKNSSLTVTDPTGRRSGQQLLNAFVEPLALDLPRFMEASDKEKADILLRIIGIGNELHLRDMEIKSIYDKRTFTGQLAQQKKHFADELISYPDAPEQPLSASDLIRRQQDILARNGENQRLRQQAQELARQEQQCLDELKRTRERIAELEKLREELDTKHTKLFNQRKNAEKTVDQLQDESTAELEASIQSIEETNRKVRANLEKARAEDEAAKYASDYDKLTDSLEQKRKERLDLLNGADLPLPELSVEDGALTYKGKRWRDMSGSRPAPGGRGHRPATQPGLRLCPSGQARADGHDHAGRVRPLARSGGSAGHRHPRLHRQRVPDHH